ncbi:unnamed protein product [marine sediment metagenome]|uniref:Uncharacterized protein n=1 Tax=marine sediment metagenome TaxID=412755 RepID=X1KSZ4_9ZZZZ
MNKQCPMKPMDYPCSKEICAWYLVHSKQCAIPKIASELQKRGKIEQYWIKLAEGDKE